MRSQQYFINGRFLTQRVTGVQRNAYELTKHLLPLLENVSVLVPKDTINESYDIKNWPLSRCGYSKGVVWEQVELPMYLARQKGSPLLINLTNTAPLAYSQQIVSIMDMATFIRPSWFTKRFALYYQWLVPKIARNSKAIFTISVNSKQDIVRFTGVPESKIKVIHCSISDIFSSDIISNSKIVEKLGLTSQGYFLAVSSLDPRKNFQRLIEIFSEIDNQFPLVIVGSKGKVFSSMGVSDKNMDIDKIIFTNYITDEELKSLYQSSLCFIYPSLYEGFGIPPLEAMANGCPTIVSNTSSLPEVCGNASLYVDPYDKESIIAAIKQVSKNEAVRVDLVKKGHENVKRFSWKSSAFKALNEIQAIA
jgi:glycosyltransferase involved in cell wall biosynthesis